MDIIFATGNQHKLEEAAEILGDGFSLHTPAEYGITGDIPETADTLEGNALIKAEYIFRRTGKPCFADDTGLFVDALNGAPGVFTARYAGEGKSPEDNIRKLLHELSAVPREKDGRKQRTARFRCVVAYVSKDAVRTFEGKVEGEIALQKSGEAGFGYDPIFLPDHYGAVKSFAQLSPEEKNAVSHRGLAMREFARWIQSHDSPSHH